MGKKPIALACSVVLVATITTALGVPAGADPAPIECAAPALTLHTPPPTSTITKWTLKAPTMTGLSPALGVFGSELQASLDASLRYNLTAWFPACYGTQTGPVYPNGVSEIPVRAPATVAYATAIALKTSGYDADVVGLPASAATDIAKRLALGLALTHRVNQGPPGWGHTWQSSYWAFLAGTAGWLLFPDMTPPERQAVARMVVDEADFQLSKPAANRVGYYANRAGKIRTPGNTRADDDAWNATILGLAAAMLPNAARAASWRQLEANDQIAAFSRPADVTSRRVVNGRRVTQWLQGSNIFDDGTLVNHGVVNPGYMAQCILNLDGLLTAGITGKPGLTTAAWNAGRVYRAMSTASFATPPFRSPGGTIYMPFSGHVYYPQGEATWGTTRVTQFLTFDTLAMSTGFGTPFGADSWAGLHMLRQMQLQSRFNDGRTFAGLSTDANAEYTYLGREQVTAGELAEAWLARYLSDHGLLQITNAKI